MLIVFHQKIFIFFICTPPLAMERESVLDRYFEDITVQLIASEKEVQDRIALFPGLWSNKLEKDGLKIKS